MEVGQKIKLVRLHRGLTQKQLGDLLNLGDLSLIHIYLRNRVPPFLLFTELHKILPAAWVQINSKKGGTRFLRCRRCSNYHFFMGCASGNVSVFAIVRALRFLDCESRCA